MSNDKKGSKEDPIGLDDLLPELARPLWEGEDDEFSAYASAAFGVALQRTGIRITGRGGAGRSAVSIEYGTNGAIVLALTPNRALRQTHIRPIVAGPLSQDAAVVEKARTFDVVACTSAITYLALRHLPVDIVRAVLTAYVH